MSRFSNVFYGNNYGSPDTADSLGPYVIGVTVVKLLTIKASAGFGAAGSSIASTAQIEGPITWGVQWQPHGVAPLGLPDDIGSTQFLFAEQVLFRGAGGAVWTPDSDPAASLPYLSTYDQWAGQIYVNDEVDLYLSYGYSGGSGLPNIYVSHTIGFSITY